mmetsp:Transcript_49881/g.132510  ORF Transcript_49881/g.132510 Transcript_49881/m.132510 type:complete len:242 (-) Transcript_49881:741-1466(-)
MSSPPLFLQMRPAKFVTVSADCGTPETPTVGPHTSDASPSLHQLAPILQRLLLRNLLGNLRLLLVLLFQIFLQVFCVPVKVKTLIPKTGPHLRRGRCKAVDSEEDDAVAFALERSCEMQLVSVEHRPRASHLQFHPRQFPSDVVESVDVFFTLKSEWHRAILIVHPHFSACIITKTENVTGAQVALVHMGTRGVVVIYLDGREGKIWSLRSQGSDQQSCDPRVFHGSRCDTQGTTVRVQTQ